MENSKSKFSRKCLIILFKLYLNLTKDSRGKSIKLWLTRTRLIRLHIHLTRYFIYAIFVEREIINKQRAVEEPAISTKIFVPIIIVINESRFNVKIDVFNAYGYRRRNKNVNKK